jgi:hypothetical protein
LEVVALAGVLLFFLERIAGALDRAGGTPRSDLARISFGVRAIETETSHLAPQVTQLNASLQEVAGKLQVVDGHLASVARALGHEEGAAT